MAYRPQANGTSERMIQTLTRYIKMYISVVDQKEDAYAERLTFSLSTARTVSVRKLHSTWYMDGTLEQLWKPRYHSVAPKSKSVRSADGDMGYSVNIAVRESRLMSS